MACNPGKYPDWESNLRHFGLQPVLNPLSYTSQVKLLLLILPFMSIMNKIEFTKHRLPVCVENGAGDIVRNTKTRRPLEFCRDARFVGRDGLRAYGLFGVIASVQDFSLNLSCDVWSQNSVTVQFKIRYAVCLTYNLVQVIHIYVIFVCLLYQQGGKKQTQFP
ncbi:hypothetical protein HJG60_008576 [Phyllostomus discolor]|uniref:Uncharacterized protein n=1 Tax=Phyllostomus discolor TaxID=89673 RepID=A0A833YXX1_9CHIR|nr:hypothetical protein HJG60_008576 [Phyllostomus discolor]